MRRTLAFGRRTTPNWINVQQYWDVSSTVPKSARSSRRAHMHCPRRRCHVSVVCAIAAAGLIAVPTVTSPTPTGQTRDIRLIDSADSLLGDGAALVIGGSGIPLPPEIYVDAADTLYLAPRGF